MKPHRIEPGPSAGKQSFPRKFGLALKKIGLDNFLLTLIGLVLAAYLWPDLGKEGGALPLHWITGVGVSFIFFFYGLRLSPTQLRAGLRNWRLHLVVQLTTFLAFPVLILGFHQLMAAGNWSPVWLGIFYVAALPSTVSSSVVMVSIAGGNLPGAIFNASISSLLGIFLTPLWMGLVLQAQPGDFDLGSVFGKLMWQVIAPVMAGVLLHARLGDWAARHKHNLKLFDQTIILLIVYAAFCDSFARGLFSTMTTGELLLLSGGMTGLFFLVMGFTLLLCRLLGFSRANEITAIFCGSKKSLVHGTVMSKVLFTETQTLGLILLPLMLYHALQLIYASILAQSMARKALSQDDFLAGTRKQ